MNTAARIISVLLHPLLMPTWLVTVLAVQFPWALQPARPDNLRAFTLFVAGLTFLLPTINLLFFRFFGQIHSVTIPNRADRLRPFFIITLLYSFCTFLFYQKLNMRLSDNFFKLLLILNALVLVAWLLTFFMKISIHSMASSAVPVIFAILSRFAEESQLFIPLLVSIVLAGLVMSARLQLQAHSLKEVLWGGAAGILTTWLCGIVLF